MEISKDYRLPMQPGEASWASWKCDGGPHTTEFEDRPQVHFLESQSRAAANGAPATKEVLGVPYAGDETKTVIVVHSSADSRANLPA